MTDELLNQELLSIISDLADNGWKFEDDGNGWYYGFNQNRRVITFKYKDVQDLVKAILSDVFDDPGVYEVHFNLPNLDE